MVLEPDVPTQGERFDAEFAALSKGDLARLKRSAEINSIHTRLDPEELFAEAVCRIKDGRRTWPPEVPLVTFFRNVMGSIANAERKIRSRESFDGSFAYRSGGGRSGAVIVTLDAFSSPEPSPEEDAIKIQTRKLIRTLFENYPVELELVDRMFRGLDGKELQGDFTDVTFRRAMARIRNTIIAYSEHSR